MIQQHDSCWSLAKGKLLLQEQVREYLLFSAFFVLSVLQSTKRTCIVHPWLCLASIHAVIST